MNRKTSLCVFAALGTFGFLQPTVSSAVEAAKAPASNSAAPSSAPGTPAPTSPAIANTVPAPQVVANPQAAPGKTAPNSNNNVIANPAAASANPTSAKTNPVNASATRAPAQATPGSNDLGAVAGPAGEAAGKPGVVVPPPPEQIPNSNMQIPNSNTLVPAAQMPGGQQPVQNAPPKPQQPAANMVSTVVDTSALKEKVKDIAVIKTSLGQIKIRLYSKVAPKNVENFKALAKGEKEFLDAKSSQRVRRPFYRGLFFHKVVKDFIVSAGCPFGNGKGGPGYAIVDEFSPVLRHNKPGMVSMSNVGKDSNGSQFFITLGSRPEFDDKYTIIGEVIEGMDVVKAINKVRVGPTERPIQKIEISEIEIEQQ